METSCKEVSALLLTTSSLSVKARQQRLPGDQGNLCCVCGNCHPDPACAVAHCHPCSLWCKMRLPLLWYHQKLPQMAWPHCLCCVSKKTCKPAELCQFPLQLLNGGLVGRFLLSYRMIGALHEMSEIPLSASRKQNTWADSFTSFNHGLLYNHWKGDCSFLE